LIAVAVSPIATWAQIQPTLRLSKTVGPPTTKLKVSGQGFTPNADVSIAFDSAVLARSRTDDSGTFSRVSLRVPQLAMPGNHRVSGVDPAGLSGVAPFLVQTDWPQFHVSQLHTGFNQFEFQLSAANVGSLSPAWTNSAFDCSTPVVARGSVYFGDGGNQGVFALDSKSGNQLWVFPTSGIVCGAVAVAPAPTLSGGMVFFEDGRGPADPGNLYGVTANFGKLVWSTNFEIGFTGAPTVANGILYATNMAGTLYALKASTGAPIWSFHGSIGEFEAPTVAGGVVYAVGWNVYALNANTGALLWSRPLVGGNASTPAIVSGTLYLNDNTQIIALNAGNGAPLWNYPTGNTVFSSPAVAKGVMYVGSQDAKVYALNAKTGALVWSFTTGGPINDCSPGIANGVVYIASSDGYLYGLDAGNGNVLWKYTNGSNPSFSSPVVVDGTVYISFDGTLYAFR